MTELISIEIDPKSFLYEHCTMPALPEVLTKVQQIMQSDDVSIERVANHISSDAALVAQILKTVNSAYYSLPRGIADVKMAVAFLGINEVYRIILSISVMNALAADEKNEFSKIWFHSLYTALCAKHLTQQYEPLLPVEEIWTAAILHDIGKLVYLKFFPDHYRALNQHSQKTGCLFSEAEDHYSLPSSAYLGTLLCDHWRLPRKIRDACSLHNLQDLANSGDDESNSSFTNMIILGNLMATLMTDELQKEKKDKISDAIMTILGLSNEDFLVLMGKISELKVEAEQLMQQLR